MTSPRPPHQRTLHLLLGGALVALSVALDRLLGIPPAWGPAQTAGVTLGLGVVLVGLIARGRLARLSTGLALAGLVALATVAAAELGCRALGHDFAHQERAHLAIPPYFRESTVPLGEVYFRRPGPQRWEGQVLNVRLEQLGIVPNPFAGEEPVVVEYDRDGFRNPPGLEDWDLAVIGDSFTELGYLPHEELFTTMLAGELGLRVKNLGVSETGNLSHLEYLRSYGLAPSTRDVLLVFFEGNDPLETAVERRNLLRFRATGERPMREFERQTSLVRALYGALAGPEPRRVHRLDAAVFTGRGAGRGEPLSVFFAPRPLPEITQQLLDHYAARDPASEAGPDLETTRREVDVEAALEQAFSELAQVVEDHGARAWVAFMPCKARVHHGQLEFTERALPSVRDWQPTDFPGEVRALAERHRIQFVDLTPALVADAREHGALLYNTMYDCHLNRRGSRVVADALVTALRGRLGARD